MEMIISMTAAGLGMSAIGIAWKAYRKSLECRNLLEYTEKQIQDLDDEVSKNRETVGSALNRLNEQSRRVAWVEAKVRKPQVNRKKLSTTAYYPRPLSPRRNRASSNVATVFYRSPLAVKTRKRLPPLSE